MAEEIVNDLSPVRFKTCYGAQRGRVPYNSELFLTLIAANVLTTNTA